MKKFQTKWKWKMRFWQIACEGEGGKEGMDAESPFCPIPSIDDSDKWNDGDVIEEGNSELGIHNVIFEMTNVTIQFHTHAPATRTRIHSVQLTNLIKSTKYWQLSILLHILTYRLAMAFLPRSLSLSLSLCRLLSGNVNVAMFCWGYKFSEYIPSSPFSHSKFVCFKFSPIEE